MYLFTLGECIELEQRLNVFPARQRTNFTDIREIDHFGKTLSRSIAEDRPLHVSRLELAASHSNCASLIDESLRNVHRLSISFGKAKGDVDLIVGSRFTYPLHLWAINLERVLHILNAKVEVYWSRPSRWSA